MFRLNEMVRKLQLANDQLQQSQSAYRETKYKAFILGNSIFLCYYFMSFKEHLYHNVHLMYEQCIIKYRIFEKNIYL